MTLTPMEQRLRDLERAVGEHHQLEAQYQQLSGPQAAQIKAKLDEAARRVRMLRVAALQTIQSGDVASLIRALGVVHAYEPCMLLGVGSLPGLISCTRSQFSLHARPQNLGWGASDAIPARIDEAIVIQVTAVLHSLGLRWREPHEKGRVRLPEPVLSRAFNQRFDPKARFRTEDFEGYAHPTLVRGAPNVCGPIVNELAARGLYCWEDLTLRSLADLRRLGLHGSQDPARPEGQFALVQREMRRRGLRFQKEAAPAAVEMDVIDVDKINRESIDEKELLSFEDRIKVRDKVGQVVNTIDVKNEFEDRVGAEDEAAHNYNEQVGTAGIVEAYEEGEEVDVVEEEAAADQSAGQPPVQPPA
jgi:hypothetical protein